jgi:hypothetical protein
MEPHPKLAKPGRRRPYYLFGSMRGFSSALQSFFIFLLRPFIYEWKRRLPVENKKKTRLGCMKKKELRPLAKMGFWPISTKDGI